MNTGVDQNLKTPGQRLKDARELKDLSLGVIAQRLRLSEHQVQALENDDYDPFPAVAYVRGYLRSYAAIVELNSDQLVEQLDKNVRTAPVLEPFASQPEQQTGSGDKHIKAVTYSLIATLVLLLGLWWQSNRSVPAISSEKSPVVLDDQDIEKSEQVGTSLEANVVEIIQTDVELNNGTKLLMPTESENTHVVEAGQEEPRVLEHVFAIVQFSELPTAPDQTPHGELSNELLSISEEVKTTQQAQQQPSVASTEVTEAHTGEFDDQRIILQFTEESWVEITDNSNKIRFSRIGTPGEVVSLTGGAPFSVVIGKASVVIMNYQGEIIDLDSLARGEVARFTIDESGAYR